MSHFPIAQPSVSFPGLQPAATQMQHRPVMMPSAAPVGQLGCVGCSGSPNFGDDPALAKPATPTWLKILGGLAFGAVAITIVSFTMKK